MDTLYNYYNSKGQALPSVSDRATTAASAGIQNYTGTSQQNTDLLGYLTKNPVTGNTSASTIGTAPVNVPPPTNTQGTLDAQVASLAQPVQDAQTQDTKSQNDVSTATSDIALLNKQLGNQTADQNQAEQDQGIPTLNKDLIDLQNQARQQNIEYNTTPYSLAGQGRGLTTGLLRGQEAVKQRQIGIDLLVTNSNIQAKQGNIVLAQSLADKAVAAKYDPIKADIESKKYTLDNLYKDLSRSDQKLADAKKQQWDLQLKQIDKQQAEDKTKQALIIDAAGQGVSPALLSKAQQASTPEEASQILGILPNNALEMQSKIQSITASKASVAKIYADIAADNSKNNPKNFVTPPAINPQTGKVDPATQLATVIAGSGTKDNANLQAIGGVVSALQNFAQNNPDGSFPGIGIFRAGPLTVGPKGTSNQNSINGINLKVQQWASGAALTDAQTQQVAKMTPKENDTAKIVKQKTNALTNFMLAQAQGLLTTQGIKYTPPSVDFFDDKGLSSLSNNSFLNTIPGNYGSPTVSNQAFFAQ